jgi:hypothetical protein
MKAKDKKVLRKPKTSAKQATKEKPLEELSPEDLEKVAGGYLVNFRPYRRRFLG